MDMIRKLTVKELADRLGTRPRNIRDRARRRGIALEPTFKLGHILYLVTPEQAEQIERSME